MLTSFVYRKKGLEWDLSRKDLAKVLWEKDALVWVDLEDPSEFESDLLVELFNFHPLAVEDCLIEHSEPKLDDYDEYLFLVVHAAAKEKGEELKTAELNLFVNKNYVVTFHKQPIPSIQSVRNDVMRRQGTPLSDGTDMLVHAILDRLVDRYLPVLTEHERRIDEIEDKLFEDAGDDVLRRILDAQKDVLFLRRIMSPQRETMSHLSRSAHSFVQSNHLIYYRDIYDHLFRYHQMAEELHGVLNGVLQVYFSHVSFKLNQVIKTLTVIATIGLPPVVIASIYGMNFKAMPELTWEWGYFFSLGLMTLSSIVLVVFMKVKKWF
jgi:magnesium transporter